MVIEDRLGTVRLRKVEAVVDLQTLADRLYGSKRERVNFQDIYPLFLVNFSIFKGTGSMLIVCVYEGLGERDKCTAKTHPTLEHTDKTGAQDTPTLVLVHNNRQIRQVHKTPLPWYWCTTTDR